MKLWVADLAGFCPFTAKEQSCTTHQTLSLSLSFEYYLERKITSMRSTERVTLASNEGYKV